MSYEAWGSSDEPATKWEDTAIAQEFGDVVSAFNKWKNSNYMEIGEDPAILEKTRAIEEAIGDLFVFMEGEF